LLKKLEAPYLPKVESSASLEKESMFVKNKTKEAEKVPDGQDPFASW
jgi:hypothetical protein